MTQKRKLRLRTRIAVWLLFRCEYIGRWIADTGPHIWLLYCLQDPRDRHP